MDYLAQPHLAAGPGPIVYYTTDLDSEYTTGMYVQHVNTYMYIYKYNVPVHA